MKEFFKKIIPSFLLNFYYLLFPFLGALIYGFPSRKLKIIGVTGTNGKTTTTEMIVKIFEEAGEKTALINSIRFKIGKKEEKNTLRMTMPGRFFIQRFLRKAVNKGCKYAVLEVTSEGIKQFRHKFIDFEIAVFTNLSPEHIESHGSYEKYKKTKGALFEATKNIHIINIEDKEAGFFGGFEAKRKITYGLQRGEVNLKKYPLKLKLQGNFNLYNALAALSVAISQGIDFKICQRALAKIEKMPGRMEEVISRPFKVIVDYAFTPNALEKVYQTVIRSLNHSNHHSLICVLGSCGGGRDKWKRPVLGELAAKYCKTVIVTTEDPYDEDPMEIIKQVASGTKGRAKEILDRRAAIKEALRLAKEGDIVVITGKGCEPSICIGNKKIPWDDRRVVREEFNKLKINL